MDVTPREEIPALRAAEMKANAELAAALAKASGEFKPVAKNRAVQIRMKEGGTYRFEYADLEQLISCTRDALSKHGLAVVQRVLGDTLITELLHGGGGVLASTMRLPNPGQDPKTYGAAITYLRRYSYAALLCLAADDDLDEDGQEAGAGRDPGVGHNPRREEPSPRHGSEERQAPRARPAAQAEARLASGPQLKWAKERLATLDQEEATKILAAHGLQALDSDLTVAAFEALKKDLLK